jgi:hypothetical protein
MAETQENYDRRKLKHEFSQYTQAAPVEIEGESDTLVDDADTLVDDADSPGFDAIEATLRLLVGGTCNLTDIIINQLRQTEESVELDNSPSTVDSDESLTTLMRYALVGQLFDAQRRLRGELSSPESRLISIAGSASRVFEPFAKTSLAVQVRQRARVLSEQVLDELVRLIQIGRREEAFGRITSRDVANKIMDEIFGYMAENPEIAELVRQQGRGMVAQNLEIVRNRTASRDNSLEGVFRRVLHKPPRSELSGPPDIVKMQATDDGEFDTSLS